jgi:hypothetical protein
MIFDQLKVPQRKVKEEVVVMVVDWLRLLAVEVKARDLVPVEHRVLSLKVDRLHGIVDCLI